MEYDDDLDREIDEEMGWAHEIKSKRDRIKKVASPYSGLSFLKRFALPAPLRGAIAGTFRAVGKVVFFPLISPLGYSKSFNLDGDMMVVKRSWQWRVADAILTRLMLTPVIIAVFLIGIVYATTHPQRIEANSTPESFGIYFKRVHLVTVDGQGLSAWYMPTITAEEMSFDPEASLAQRWPSVVLCHGLGATQDQYLPLAEKLHRAGFAVLMLDLRGQGESEAAAVTYGLRERMDVLAGVKYLRELPNIDPAKVCIVGHDIGAVAGLQATSIDSSVAAVVADGLWPRFDQRARSIFSHPAGTQLPISWLGPLYTVTFEVAVRDRLSQLEPNAIVRSIHTQPVLFIARQGPQYASLQEVSNLATSVGSHHEILSVDEMDSNVDTRTRDFLMQSTHWKGARMPRGIGELQKLLDKRVK